MNFKKIREKLKWLDPFTYVDDYIIPRINPKNNPLYNDIIYVIFAFLFAFLIYSALGLFLGTESPMVIVVSGSMEPILYRGDIVILQGVTQEQVKASEIEYAGSLDKLPLRYYANPLCTKVGDEELFRCDSFLETLSSGIIENDYFVTKKIEFENGKTIDIEKEGDIIVYESSVLKQPIIHRAIAKIKAKDGVFFLTKGDSKNNSLIDQQANITKYAIKEEEIKGRFLFRVPLLGYIKLLIFDDLMNLIFGCKTPGGCTFP